MLFASLVALTLWLFPLQIVTIYLRPSDLDNAKVVKEAVYFLNWAALFQLFYSIQATVVAALTAIKDTRVPMLINILAFWGVGLSVGYLTGFVLGWGGTGIWLGLILGPVLTTVIYFWRFYHLVYYKVDFLQKDNDNALEVT